MRSLPVVIWVMSYAITTVKMVAMLGQGAATQPVVHLNDKTRIGTFIGMAPDDLKKIGGIDFVDLNLTDKDYWKLGLTKVKTPT